MDHGIARSAIGLLGLLSLSFVRPSAAEPSVRNFALIVANNKSLSLSQPDLQYADDDAARYHRLFRSLAADTDVVLLTQFDRASRSLYPDLAQVAQAPTRAELENASVRLGAAIRLAGVNGQRTSFYFVYAGHGEMAEGRGFLELLDARIDGTFIEQQILDLVPADSKHLLLDSCNSFFVINPRKPGGRRWATPKDMALGFSARHPEVGLFLSTNSDSEVFEWSEIESGVFSHEVRSGLSGGADTNADGNVSYSELAGFVENANSGIVREGLRPHLFFRGPHGNAQAPLFPTAQMAGRRIALNAPAGRYWVKNETGGRVIDVHKEAGKMTLVVPEADSGALAIFEERRLLASIKPSVIEHYVEPGSAPVILADQAPKAPEIGARGGRLFGSIFAAPYGPVAYAKYMKEQATAPEPVYGLTDADLVRMDHYLAALAGQDRTQRMGLGLAGTGIGAIGAGIATGLALDEKSRHDYPYGVLTLAGGSLAAIGAGLYCALTKSPGEQALQSFRLELADNRAGGAQLFVRTDAWLTKIADQERTRRNTQFWVFEGLGLGLATIGTIAAVAPAKDEENPYMLPAIAFSESAMFIAMGFFILSQPTPTERMLQLYREDPGLKLHFAVAPTQNGMSLGLSGLF